MRVGFIGLGAMGRPMIANLLRAGHALTVWARRPESAQAVLELGATWADSPAELARASEVVITIVTSDADVEALVFGASGLAEGLAPGAVHVDMSTISPSAARRIAARHATRGVGWVDAPVSGGEQGAIDASLAIMAGASEADLVRVMPVLRALGRRIVHIGEAGAGQVAKACNQMVMVAAVQACAEAMQLAAAHGVEVAAVRTALMGGSAASRMLELMGGRMVERDFQAGVQARLHHKDFGLLLGEAARAGVPLPIAGLVGQQLNALVAQGWGGDDVSSLLRVLEQTNGRGGQG